MFENNSTKSNPAPQAAKKRRFWRIRAGGKKSGKTVACIPNFVCLKG
jgi:hypothetical protein